MELASVRRLGTCAAGLLFVGLAAGACASGAPVATPGATASGPGSTGAGAGSPASTAAASATTVIAADLTFGQEPGLAASGTVTFDDGRTITATGSDGTTFELVVPRFAVAAETTITVTPLSDVRGVGDRPAHAVRLEPEGLQFAEWPRLTITPATPIPVPNQVMFQATGDGQQVHAALIDRTSEEIVLLLPHFSVAGSGYAEAEGVWQAERSLGRVEAIAHEIGKVLTALREREFREGPTDGDPGLADRLRPLFEAAEREVSGPLRDAALKSCAATELYVQGLISLERQRQLIGFSTDETVAATEAAITAMRDNAFGRCERLKIRECRAKRAPAILVAFWISWERQRHLMGDDDVSGLADNLYERARRLCLLRDYRVDKTLSMTESNVTVSIRYTGIKCGGPGGEWTIDSAGTLSAYGGTADIGGPLVVEIDEETLEGTVDGRADFRARDPNHPNPSTQGRFSGTARFVETPATLELTVTSGGGSGYSYGFLDTGFTSPGTLTLPVEEGEFCLEPPD